MRSGTQNGGDDVFYLLEIFSLFQGGKWNKVVSKENKILKEVVSVNPAVKTLLGVLEWVGYICCLVVLKNPNKSKPKSHRHTWNSAMLPKSTGAHVTAQRTRDHTNTDQNLLCGLQSSLFTHWYYTTAIRLESVGLHCQSTEAGASQGLTGQSTQLFAMLEEETAFHLKSFFLLPDSFLPQLSPKNRSESSRILPWSMVLCIFQKKKIFEKF